MHPHQPIFMDIFCKYEKRERPCGRLPFWIGNDEIVIIYIYFSSPVAAPCSLISTFSVSPS